MIRIPIRIAHLLTGDWEVWCSGTDIMCVLDHKVFADKDKAIQHAQRHVSRYHIEWNIDD